MNSSIPGRSGNELTVDDSLIAIPSMLMRETRWRSAEWTSESRQCVLYYARAHVLADRDQFMHHR
jgi:hypothetical protein